MKKLFYTHEETLTAIRCKPDFFRDNTKFLDKFYKGEVVFDFNGHCSSRKTKPIVPKEYEYGFRSEFGQEERIWDGIKFGYITDEKLINSKKNVDLNLQYCHINCFECGDELNFTWKNNLIKANTRCAFPNGHPEYSVWINVPSGVLVFANYFDIDKYFNCRDMSIVGLQLELEFYAKQNVIQSFCGNTCPSVYKDDNKIYIGTLGYNKEGDVADEFPGKQVASVCTDLWAWSCADLETVKKLNKNFKADIKRHYYQPVDVLPGVYKMTQYYHLNRDTGYGSGKKELYSTLELVNGKLSL